MSSTSAAESSEIAAAPPRPPIAAAMTAPNPIRPSFAMKRSPSAAMRDRMRQELQGLLNARDQIDNEARELARRRHDVQLTIDAAADMITHIERDGLEHGSDEDARAGAT